ncbi:hypothetical protein POM88_009280 [Heracleum sosnowskyi]|uniref:Uncharacterized protein n=1 Tax=Heracleum sosnowskyi TaxID=360622 RepID=A0AAD8JBP1_9APIA|nr:hypothetical protein POM88_009280 [Heracleum sosnowskyi]
MWVMQTYLTNVWNLSVSHAAGIVNVWNGLTFFLPIPFAFFADSFLGNFYMLMFSCFVDAIGLGFLTLSTPQFLGPCKENEPRCIGRKQKTLFYFALALIAAGLASRTVSQVQFFKERKGETTDSNKEEICDCGLGQKLSCCVMIIVITISSLVLPFIQSWSVKFGIPAICSLLALLIFLNGQFWHPSQRIGPQGSPLTTFSRVFVAAISKKSQKLPEDHNNEFFFNESDDHVELTRSLRFLNKAAIILPTPSVEEQKKNKWHLCSVKEVEDTKVCLRMTPLCITLILCGLVLSLGNTYFLEQANHLNQTLGRLKVNIVIFFFFSFSANIISTYIYRIAKIWPLVKNKYFPLFGIAFALITSILCCINAAKVESRRLELVSKNKSMSMFTLVPQYLLLGMFTGISSTCYEELFKSRYPSSMNKYVQYFTLGLTGIGIAASYLLVYIVGKTYLTNVWKLSVKHAAGIINIWNGVTYSLMISFEFFADSFFGNFYTILFSCFVDAIGMWFLTVSTPPFNIGPCNKYEPECVSRAQKTLFYIALTLIALGVGSRITVGAFIEEQNIEWEKEATDSNKEIAVTSEYTAICRFCSFGQQLGCLVVAVVTIVGCFVLPFIKSWSIKFGIAAICSLVALLSFLSGLFWHPYKRKEPQGSPLTTIIRVLVVAICKKSEKLPEDHNEAKNLFMSDDPVELTRSLAWLDKAAIILPTPAEEQQKKHKWHLCSVREVEDVKACLQMAPLCIPFILCGLVFSLGNTYFLEQANHMNQNLGHLKVPVLIFYLFPGGAGYISGYIYSTFKGWLPEKYRKYFPFLGIAFALITSVVCCITAGLIENRRLKLIRTIPELLKDDPPKNIKIPMTMFWLVPQYLLLGVFSGISTTCFAELFNSGYPPSMNKYLESLTIGLPAIGTAASYLLVYIVDKVTKRGKTSWFKHTINQSRLDRYYWTLAVISSLNLFLYILVAKMSPEPRSEPPEKKKDEEC